MFMNHIGTASSEAGRQPWNQARECENTNKNDDTGNSLCGRSKTGSEGSGEDTEPPLSSPSPLPFISTSLKTNRSSFSGRWLRLLKFIFTILYQRHQPRDLWDSPAPSSLQDGAALSTFFSLNLNTASLFPASSSCSYPLPVNLLSHTIIESCTSLRLCRPTLLSSALPEPLEKASITSVNDTSRSHYRQNLVSVALLPNLPP